MTAIGASKPPSSTRARFDALQPGARVMLAGKVKYFREQVQLSHPQWA